MIYECILKFTSASPSGVAFGDPISAAEMPFSVSNCQLYEPSGEMSCD